MQQAMTTIVAEYDAMQIIRRGNEYYWQQKTDGKENGPFATLLEAEDDIQFHEDVIEYCESLGEANDLTGRVGWVDWESRFAQEDHEVL